MKAAIFIAGASALLASAKPINKRVMETEWVTDYVTVTVIAGEEQQAQATDYVVLEAEPTTTTTTIKKTVHKSKVYEQPKASYTTVWVESQPTTTSEPEVQYSTVWVQAEDEATTSSSTSTTTTSKKATATKAVVEDTSDSSDNLSLKGDYSTVMTNYHNIHRSNHSVSDVTWDSGLAASALVLANRCKFEHDMDINGGGYGQNIAAWASSEIGEGEGNKYGAVSVTDQWYNSEMENWSFYGQANPPEGMNIDLYGHFTQVVWKGTSKIGCATAYCPSGQMYDGMNAYFTVCNYDGPGNYGGEYGKNVLQPLGNKMVVV
jgi:uncharacterized protein YkwD